MKVTNKANSILVLTPIIGSVIFVVLYILAAFLYPGGSQADKNAIGFSWINNYWCNLLNDNAINGQPNAAKPFAVAGMLVLCFTLSIFWFLFPMHTGMRTYGKFIIAGSGMVAMLTAALLFTKINHDVVTNLASLFGLIATGGTFVGLYQKKWWGLFAFGMVNILLVALNNYVYYSATHIVYLPIIQKISFGSFLLWICSISLKWRRMNMAL